MSQTGEYALVMIHDSSYWELEVGGEAWTWFMSLSPEERAVEVVRAYLNSKSCGEG